MKKKNFNVRIVQRCCPASAVEVINEYFDSPHSALRSFQEAMCEAICCQYIQVEFLRLCENEVDYEVVHSCKLESLNWF